MRKIAVLDHATHLGGGERVLITLLEGLNNKKYDVTVIATGEGQFTEELIKKNIKYKIIHTNKKMLNVKRGNKINIIDKINIIISTLAYVKKLTKYIKDENFDIIYTNSMKAHIYGSLVAFFSNKKLIWRVHDIITVNTFNKFTRKVFILFANNFPQKIIPVSNAVKSSMIKNGINKSSFEVIYNGLNKRVVKSESRNYYNEFNIDKNKKVIGIVGWLIPWKGQDVFLRAAKEILNTNKEIHFLVVGGPLEDSKEYVSELERYVKDENIEEFVTFTGHRSDIDELLRFMDISIHCSKEPDPLPTVILESMINSTPVIGVNLGGVPEMIIDNYTGRLFNSEDYIDLAEIIKEMLSNKLKLQYYSTNALKHIKDNFNINNYILKHEQIFDDM